jgi:transposase
VCEHTLKRAEQTMTNHNAKNDEAVLGIDLAKTSFQLHGVDSLGVTVLKKKLTRKNLCEYIAQLPVCTIGIEACGGAHHWGECLVSLVMLCI